MRAWHLLFLPVWIFVLSIVANSEGTAPAAPAYAGALRCVEAGSTAPIHGDYTFLRSWAIEGDVSFCAAVAKRGGARQRTLVRQRHAAALVGLFSVPFRRQPWLQDSWQPPKRTSAVPHLQGMGWPVVAAVPFSGAWGGGLFSVALLRGACPPAGPAATDAAVFPPHSAAAAVFAGCGASPLNASAADVAVVANTNTWAAYNTAGACDMSLYTWSHTKPGLKSPSNVVDKNKCPQHPPVVFPPRQQELTVSHARPLTGLVSQYGAGALPAEKAAAGIQNDEQLWREALAADGRDEQVATSCPTLGQLLQPGSRGSAPPPPCLDAVNAALERFRTSQFRALHTWGHGIAQEVGLAHLLWSRTGVLQPSNTDYITDYDVHTEGPWLLARYRVILLLAHPEYWSAPMYDALAHYQRLGGSVLYLGGNGIYRSVVWDSAPDGSPRLRRMVQQDGVTHAVPAKGVPAAAAAGWYAHPRLELVQQPCPAEGGLPRVHPRSAVLGAWEGRPGAAHAAWHREIAAASPWKQPSTGAWFAPAQQAEHDPEQGGTADFTLPSLTGAAPMCGPQRDVVRLLGLRYEPRSAGVSQCSPIMLSAAALDELSLPVATVSNASLDLPAGASLLGVALLQLQAACAAPGAAEFIPACDILAENAGSAETVAALASSALISGTCGASWETDGPLPGVSRKQREALLGCAIRHGPPPSRHNTAQSLGAVQLLDTGFGGVVGALASLGWAGDLLRQDPEAKTAKAGEAALAALVQRVIRHAGVLQQPDFEATLPHLEAAFTLPAVTNSSSVAGWQAWRDCERGGQAGWLSPQPCVHNRINSASVFAVLQPRWKLQAGTVPSAWWPSGAAAEPHTAAAHHGFLGLGNGLLGWSMHFPVQIDTTVCDGCADMSVVERRWASADRRLHHRGLFLDVCSPKWGATPALWVLMCVLMACIAYLVVVRGYWGSSLSGRCRGQHRRVHIGCAQATCVVGRPVSAQSTGCDPSSVRLNCFRCERDRKSNCTVVVVFVLAAVVLLSSAVLGRTPCINPAKSAVANVEEVPGHDGACCLVDTCHAKQQQAADAGSFVFVCGSGTNAVNGSHVSLLLLPTSLEDFASQSMMESETHRRKGRRPMSPLVVGRTGTKLLGVPVHTVGARELENLDHSRGATGHSRGSAKQPSPHSLRQVLTSAGLHCPSSSASGPQSSPASPLCACCGSGAIVALSWPDLLAQCPGQNIEQVALLLQAALVNTGARVVILGVDEGVSAPLAVAGRVLASGLHSVPVLPVTQAHWTRVLAGVDAASNLLRQFL